MVYVHKIHIQQTEAGGLLPEQYETLYQGKGGEENEKNLISLKQNSV